MLGQAGSLGPPSPHDNEPDAREGQEFGFVGGCLEPGFAGGLPSAGVDW